MRLEIKLAIVESRNILNLVLDECISEEFEEIKEIVCEGTVSIDFFAAEFAKHNGLKLIEILPQYERCGRTAPIIRIKKIVDYADKIIIFRKWQLKRNTIGYPICSNSRETLNYHTL